MTAAVSENVNFDPEKLRAKYREERDKRIRADGNDQYIEVAGDFSHYIDDPYVEPGFDREALDKQVEVLIIGGGFGGMLAAARLRDTGINDLLIVEKGGGFGGTWYWNRYCLVEYRFSFLERITIFIFKVLKRLKLKSI